MTPIQLTPGLVSRQETPSLDPSLPNTTKAPCTLGVVSFLTGIAAVVVALRSYVRAWILTRFGPDDYIMLVAMACSFAVLGCFAGESRHGLGRYNQYITQADQVMLRKYTFYHSIVVMVGISAVKMSVGFFLLRVAEQTRFRKLIIGMLIFLLPFTLACAGTLVFQCTPVSAAWDLSRRPSARCFSSHTFTSIGLFNSAVNVATDVLFAALPIPMFGSIKVNKRTKASLMAILSLGYLACTAAVVKIVSQTQVLKLKDPYRDSTFATWNSVELNVGILAGSLPTIRPLVRSIIDTTTRTITSRPHTPHHHHRTSSHYYIRQNSAIAMEPMKSSDRDRDRDGDGADRRLDFGFGFGFGAPSARKYNVEVSATNHSRDSDDKESGLGLHMLSSLGKSKSAELLREAPPASAIVRTTEVHVHTDERGAEEKGPVAGKNFHCLIPPGGKGPVDRH
ncbi:hypothetical protein VTN02DRAFT_5679 [Thermoascus thermophilus]